MLNLSQSISMQSDHPQIALKCLIIFLHENGILMTESFGKKLAWWQYGYIQSILIFFHRLFGEDSTFDQIIEVYCIETNDPIGFVH